MRMVTITVSEDVAHSVLSHAKTMVVNVWEGYEKERQAELVKIADFELALNKGEKSET